MGITAFEQPVISDGIRAIVSRCCEAYPAITVDEEILGGIPHIAGTRVSVAQVLSRVYVHGSIKDVAAYYDGTISVDQVKQALAYAQVFIESVCERSEGNGR